MESKLFSYVANGEVGRINDTKKAFNGRSKNDSIHVEFSTRPSIQ